MSWEPTSFSYGYDPFMTEQDSHNTGAQDKNRGVKLKKKRLLLNTTACNSQVSVSEDLVLNKKKFY